MTTICKPLPDRDQILFVYGTLKEGEGNHFWLPPLRRIDVGCATTVDRYPLVVPPAFGIPYLLHRKGDGQQIEGQLFRLSYGELALIDQLESHPNWYRRTMIPVSCNGTTYDAWAYFLEPENVTSRLLRLPRLKRFSTQGFNRHASNPITD